MSDLLVFTPDPESCLAVGPNQWTWFPYKTTGAVKEIFASYVALPVPHDGWFVHAPSQTVYYADDGNLQHVAGQQDRTGNDDGPGATAKFGMGGLYAGAGSAVGPNGELYLSCQAYDSIKKVTRNPNVVTTFKTGIYTNCIGCTATTLLANVGNSIQEFDLATGAMIGSWGIPALNLDSWLGGFVIDGGFWVYGWEQPGSASVLYRWDIANHVFEHKIGRRAAQGGGAPEDSADPLNVWLYKCSPAWWSADARQWRFTGGDSYFEIFIDMATGSKTRMNDGTLQVLNTRQGIAATIFVGGMKDDLPISYNYPWPPYPKGLPTERFYNNGQIIAGGGGTVLNAQFVSQVVPATVEAGKPAHYKVVMKNSGDIPWSEAAQIRLGGENPMDNPTFGGRQYIAPGVTVAPGEEYPFEFDWTLPNEGQYNFQWKMVQDGVQWFGALTPNVVVTVIPNGGGMTKTLSWQTQMQNIPGGDHYKVTINGTAQPPVPYDATEVVLEVSPGDVIEAQTADAADNWLAAPQSVTVPGEPGSKIIISLQLS